MTKRINSTRQKSRLYNKSIMTSRLVNRIVNELRIQDTPCLTVQHVNGNEPFVEGLNICSQSYDENNQTYTGDHKPLWYKN